MIILNGLYFDTIGTSEANALRRPSSMQDSVTGYLIVTQSQYVRWRFAMTLSVDKAQRDRLIDLFATSLGPIDFIDFRGFSWLREAGTDDDTHAYNTGAYFMAGQDLEGAIQQGNGYNACGQSWNVPLVLIPNARRVAGNSASPAPPGPSDTTMQPHETPGGTINGVNAVFTTALEYEFILLFRNGLEMKLGVDFTYSGSTITFLAGQIPETGDLLDCFGVL